MAIVPKCDCQSRTGETETRVGCMCNSRIGVNYKSCACNSRNVCTCQARNNGTCATNASGWGSVGNCLSRIIYYSDIVCGSRVSEYKITPDCMCNSRTVR